MAEIRRSRLETLKTRASRTFYFLLGAALGAAGLWGAVNVSGAAADAVNLVPESQLSSAQLLIGDLEERMREAADAIQRALERHLAEEGLDSLFDALERLVPSVGE